MIPLLTANWSVSSDIKTLFHANREQWPPKKKKWTVSQPNCSLSDIKALFHPNRELWTPKKEKLPVSLSQRTLHCYLEKDKPELFSISTQNSALLYWKRQDFTVPHPNRELTFDILSKIKIYIYISIYLLGNWKNAFIIYVDVTSS